MKKGEGEISPSKNPLPAICPALLTTLAPRKISSSATRTNPPCPISGAMNVYSPRGMFISPVSLIASTRPLGASRWSVAAADAVRWYHSLPFDLAALSELDAALSLSSSSFYLISGLIITSLSSEGSGRMAQEVSGGP